MYKIIELFFLCIVISLIALSGCIEEDSNILSISDTGFTGDSLEINVVDYKLVDSFETMNVPNKPVYYYPPEGAQFLLVYLEVTNVGTDKTSSDTITLSKDLISSSNGDTPILSYSGNNLEANDNIIVYRSSDSYSDIIYSISSINTHYLFSLVDKNHEPKFKGYENVYPEVTKEGWIAFLVPHNIDLTEIYIKVHGLTWAF
ncbi:hypothetical protein [Methanococcoides burtonii]|uniref:DUF4352 domain-containing protein n=1 Tax=Methanococcoides burtonii (strain DSM 6242 / NBRC 107633 / OCM 468 / ACE-M) TaxID=259564 RepID=Q12X98_METBU|nr:hypothetical protein [Methanococcoides burtonii]ABE51928.1 Hypothetical protein Mbur_0988 [Methanococcoides burtonii DSM 6242]